MFKLRGLHDNKKPGDFFDDSLAIITAFFMIFKKWIWHLAKMTITSVTFQQFGRSHYVLWPTDPCISASTDLWIFGCQYLYPRIHVSPHLWLLGFSYSWTSLNPYPSVVRWTVWAMVYEGLWANRGMVKKQILKVRKKMQKIIKEM